MAGKVFKRRCYLRIGGLSGPVMLQISNYWQTGAELSINLLPDLDLAAQLPQWQAHHPKLELKTLLNPLWPKRLGQYLFKTQLRNKAMQQYTPRELTQVASQLHQWRIRPTGTEGFRKAEVTRGGVDTAEISSKTFEAKKQAGLYFIGEVLDVTGWLGGYNFQWAWASGYCAGQFV